MIYTLLRRLKLRLQNELRSTSSTTLHAQHGSIIIPIAGVIFVGFVLLGSVQLGYAFYIKRELQNTADTAAMSAALHLTSSYIDPSMCAAAMNAARDNAQTNLSALGNTNKNTIESVCGEWNPEKYQGPMHFTRTGTELNAIYVKIERDQPAIMPFMQNSTISAESIAHIEADDHIAAFSVGPQLANLDDGLLTGLLETVGLDVTNTTLIDYRGLANVKITPAGLLEQLGISVPADISVGNLEELLGTDLGAEVLFIDIIEASIKAAAASGNELLDAQADLLTAIRTHLSPELSLNLFTDSLKEGLFVLVSSQNDGSNADKKAGLDAEVSLSSILDVMVGVANKSNAISLNSNGGTLIELPGLLKAQALVSVIEAPAIGIGGIGTKAHSANLRLFLRLCLGLGGCDSVSTGLLNLKLDLPIVIELVNATGELTEFACQADNPSTSEVRIDIKSEIAGICIGDFGIEATSASHPFSFTESCTQLLATNNSYKKEILDLQLLGIDLLKLKSAVAIPALTSKPGVHAWLSMDNPVKKIDTEPLSSTGTTLKRIIDAILGELLGGVINTKLTPTKENNATQALINEAWDKNFKNCQSGALGSSCRKESMENTVKHIQDNIENLNGSIKNIDQSVLGALGSTIGSLITLDIGGLVSGLLNTVFNLVGLIIDITPNDKKCYYNSLLGGAGSNEGCKYLITKAIEKTNTDNGSAPSIANLGIAGLLLEPILKSLDSLGDKLLTPLLESLGLKVAQVETRLLYLDCQPNVKLVY